MSTSLSSTTASMPLPASVPPTPDAKNQVRQLAAQLKGLNKSFIKQLENISESEAFIDLSYLFKEYSTHRARVLSQHSAAIKTLKVSLLNNEGLRIKSR